MTRINPPKPPADHISVHPDRRVEVGDSAFTSQGWQVCSPHCVGKLAGDIGHVARWIGFGGLRRHK